MIWDDAERFGFIPAALIEAVGDGGGAGYAALAHIYEVSSVLSGNRANWRGFGRASVLERSNLRGDHGALALVEAPWLSLGNAAMVKRPTSAARAMVKKERASEALNAGANQGVTSGHPT